MINIFQKARIRLTVWYVVIILIVSGTLSSLFYIGTTHVLDSEFERIQTRLQREHMRIVFPGARPPVPQIIAAEIVEAKRNIAMQLILINGVIVLIVGAGGYVLSSKTLRPIQLSMEEQKRFISDAAHELRTPITALKTSLEVNLMDKKLSKVARKILKENLEDVSGLESLSEGLLHLSKQDQNNIKKRKVSLKKVAAQAIHIIKPLANKKRIAIKTNNISEKLHLRGDKELLVEMMLVLLDNAIKYSKAKSSVSLNVVRKGNLANITISDSGEGISKHHLPYIFDRFYQVDESRSKSGHGLGLSIAKKIVEQHKGQISVKSELGKGTVFNISLPLT